MKFDLPSPTQFYIVYKCCSIYCLHQDLRGTYYQWCVCCCERTDIKDTVSFQNDCLSRRDKIPWETKTVRKFSTTFLSEKLTKVKPFSLAEWHSAVRDSPKLVRCYQSQSLIGDLEVREEVIQLQTTSSFCQLPVQPLLFFKGKQMSQQDYV